MKTTALRGRRHIPRTNKGNTIGSGGGWVEQSTLQPSWETESPVNRVGALLSERTVGWINTSSRYRSQRASSRPQSNCPSHVSAYSPSAIHTVSRSPTDNIILCYARTIELRQMKYLSLACSNNRITVYLHCALAAVQCIVIGPVCVCLFVCGWVCYHDNSKLRASILAKLVCW